MRPSGYYIGEPDSTIICTLSDDMQVAPRRRVPFRRVAWQTQKWTDEQRDALGRAVTKPELDGLGLSGQAAQDAALAGELDGLESFGPVPLSTIRDCGTRWRRQRAGDERTATSRLAPAAALRDLFERVVTILERDLDRELAAQRPNVDRVGKIGRTLRDLVPVARELDTTRPAPARPDPTGDGKRQHRRSAPATLADQLLEDARSQARGGQPTDGYTAHARAVSDDGTTAHVDLPPRPDDSPPTIDAAPDSSHALDSGGTEEGIRAAAALRERLGMPERGHEELA